ncbi:MAG: phosphate ABC transporter ATP-binding protein [Dehalococcoidia bacterium]|nr:phosphate ABC transporter ATP-binding protein [Dehalococcoidia bacterium]
MERPELIVQEPIVQAPAAPEPQRRDFFQVGTASGRVERAERRVSVAVEDVSAWYGSKLAVAGVSFEVLAHSVTALIGPSGCGKSTVLRCINRMHEINVGARVEGTVRLEGADVYGPNVDATRVRQRVGMVFQKPNPFPTMSIAENVAAGLRFMKIGTKSEERDRVEEALRAAALWDEVKDDLNKSGMALSGGQQQRLCIARTIAVEPEVVLMDEPCSALDPVATLKIEDLMAELAQRYTIVIVTHNLQQAARVADYTGFILLEQSDSAGHLIEYSPTSDLFTHPRDKRTEDFITGRFG